MSWNDGIYLLAILISSGAGFFYARRLGVTFLKALLLISALLVAISLALTAIYPGPGRQDESVVDLLLHPNLVFKIDRNLGLAVALFFFSLSGLVRIGFTKKKD